jgi:hypothetical protein
LKSFIFFQISYIFEFEPKSSFQISNENVINITDTIIPVKPLIPKDKNCYVSLVAQKEWQLAYPNNDSIKCLTDGILSNQFRISRNSLALMKIPRNSKDEIIYKPNGEINYKEIHPSIRPEGYLKYNLVNDRNKSKKCSFYAHRLFEMVFNDNDDIFRNTDCDHIDRFRWCNRPENTR